MLSFLRHFTLDRPSFWLGFLAATLFWWLLNRLRPHAALALQRLRESAQAARQQASLGTEARLANDVLRRAQRMHLASSLFSLDEVLIPPRLLAPPVPVEPGLPSPPEDITDWVLPYLPDWPELAAIYRAPTLSLTEALQGGADLAILGEPGSGKSVALAHLATLVARRDPQAGELAGRVPVLVFAPGLLLPPTGPEQPVQPVPPLQAAIAAYASPATQAGLSKFLEPALAQGRILLLVDGLDELAPAALEEVKSYLVILLERFPRTRLVLTAAAGQLGGLAELGVIPVAVSAWDEARRAEWILRWSDLWQRCIEHEPQDGAPPATDPTLLNAWLLDDRTPLTPLELTLKVWAAYAGDLPGPSARDAIEAYVRRLTVDVSKGRLASELLAWQMTMTLQPAVARSQAESWTSAFDGSAEAQPHPGAQPAAAGPVTMPRVLPQLTANGLLVLLPGNRLAFSHPVLAGYLAGSALSGDERASLLRQPAWTGKHQALRYLSGCENQPRWMADLLQEPNVDLLLSGLLSAARWLRDAPENIPWRTPVLRQLAGCLQNHQLDLGLRLRVLTALVTSNSAGVGVLLRQMLASPAADIRQLAALGCGALREAKSAAELSRLLADPTPNVRRAACLGLVALGSREALDAVAEVLVHGDDDLRRMAAEALANHPEEGYPALQEGSTLPDVLVRRAVVYGLERVNEPWVIDLLAKMQVADEQWLVQNAATQALERLSQPNPRLPRPIPALTETPWLIAFAGERGVGVSPGKPAQTLLLQALKEGQPEQRLAAMHALWRYGSEAAVLPLYDIYYTCESDLRAGALHALWLLASRGIPLPPPVQFGY